MSLDLAFKNTTSDYTGTGAGLAGRLTSAQADTNNWNIKVAVEALQASTGKTISSASAVGDQLTITYTDATTDVITLPSATWNMRGAFAAVSYAVNDILSESNRLYLVKIAHTGVLPFDSGRQITGNDVYQFLIGPLGQTTTTALDDATYTLQATDNLKYLRCTATSGATITIPPSSSVTIPLDAEISFCQCGGNLAFEVDTGVTLNVPEGYEAATDHAGAVVMLKNVGTDEFDIFGALVATSA